MKIGKWPASSESGTQPRDIAETNLSLAQGLPGTPELDVAALCRKVDDWAAIVDHAVRRAIKRRLKGEASDLTGDQFRVMVMITVLQRNLGVTYNLKFSEGDYDATDSRNLFLHGILTGFGGTCVTMPVLYCAIGRRLGWPLRIAFAKEHVFCRWDEGPTSTFNIEATSPGFVTHPDEHYHRWPKPISKQELDAGWYLRSLSPSEELAAFIANRGNCKYDHLQPMFAADEYLEAMKLAPGHLAYENHWRLSIATYQALRTLRNTPGGSKATLPPPRSIVELAFYHEANKHLRRIFRNQIKHRPRVAELCFTFTT